MRFAVKPLWSNVNCSHKQAPARCEPLPAEACKRLAVSGIHNQTCPLLAASSCLRQIRQSLKPNTTDLLLKLKLYCPQQKYFTVPGKTGIKIDRYTGERGRKCWRTSTSQSLNNSGRICSCLKGRYLFSQVSFKSLKVVKSSFQRSDYFWKSSKPTAAPPPPLCSKWQVFKCVKRSELRFPFQIPPSTCHTFLLLGTAVLTAGLHHTNHVWVGSDEGGLRVKTRRSGTKLWITFWIKARTKKHIIQLQPCTMFEHLVHFL